MKTTTVALGPHFDEFIQASVLGGRYTNASEVIRAGLRKLEEDERKIAALRSAIEEGEASGYVDDFDFGTEYATFDILPNGTIGLSNNTEDTYTICGSISGFTVSDSNFIGFE